jgi:hypothetical protein
MKRPSGHPGMGRARPPRCLVRWQCDSPRSLITSRRSAGRDLGRNSAVSPALSEPFLSRFSTQMDKILGFEGHIKKKLNDQKNSVFRSFRIGGAYIFDLQIFRFFSSLSFFLWSPVAPELGTDPRRKCRFCKTRSSDARVTIEAKV